MDPEETPLPHKSPLSRHRFPGLQRKATGWPGGRSHSSSYLLSLVSGPGGHWPRCSRDACRFAPQNRSVSHLRDLPGHPCVSCILSSSHAGSSLSQGLCTSVTGPPSAPVHTVLPQMYRGPWDARPTLQDPRTQPSSPGQLLVCPCPLMTESVMSSCNNIKCRKERGGGSAAAEPSPRQIFVFILFFHGFSTPALALLLAQ